MADNASGEFRLLVLTDVHLSPTGEQLSAEDFLVENVDAILSLGDVIDDNRDHARSAADGEQYEMLGQEFFATLDRVEIPVFAVPGNHDPVDCTERLVADCRHVEMIHQETKFLDIPGLSDSLRIAGWGCEQFDFRPAFLAPEYPQLDVPDAEHLTPDKVADLVLEAGGRYLSGAASTEESADVLGIRDDPQNRERFHQSCELLKKRFESILDSVGAGSGPLVLASHITPFNVPYDVRGLTSRTGSYHFGSLALRLASMEIGPLCVLSGHTHQQGMTVFETGSGYTYAHNPGALGKTIVTIENGDVRFEGTTVS